MPTSKILKSIKYKNYKAFKGQHTIDLKNLTLLFGYNNTGKSALVRSFPLLSDSMRGNKPNYFTVSFLDYSSESLRGGMFDNVVTSGESRLGFGLEWHNGDALEFELQKLGSEAEIMTSLSVSTENRQLAYIPSIDSEGMLENVNDSSDVINFHGFRLTEESTFNELISQFSNSVHWVSSTRIPPQRFFEVGVGVPLKIMPNGAGVGPAIWHLNEQNSNSIEDINGWLRATCQREIFFGALSSSATSGRMRVGLDTVSILEDSGSTHRVPILDSGEGIAQALPVVVLAAMAANGELGASPIIVVEQPELHLHPHASVELANFIIKCIQKNSSIRFILETHSESFLRALQIAILDTELSTENFSCYWTSRSDQGSVLDSISFDSEAYLSSAWPQEVFRESLNQAKRLVRLRQEKAKQNLDSSPERVE
jgi:hypothetical protein